MRTRSTRFRHRHLGLTIRLSGLIVAAALAIVAVPLIGDALAGQFNAAPQADCRVLRVIDGDTVQIRCPGRGITSARITGYDTPELFSPHCNAELRLALRATWLLRRMIWSATEIAIARGGSDRYGRALIALSVDGESAGRRIIAAGLARPYDGGRRAGWCG